MHIGIDASNIRRGGGITHLASLLSYAEPAREGFERMTLWGTDALLAKIPERPWLRRIAIQGPAAALAARALWQQCRLPGLLKHIGADVLFSPGGTLPLMAGIPTITMSQNLLPFDAAARALYAPFSGMRIKLALLRHAQSRSLAGADGVIFLSRYAQEFIQKTLGALPRRHVTVPHGIEERFRIAPRPALPPGAFGPARPFRLLYVSIVDVYKHQTEVAEAVALLRQRGISLTVDFVGPAYPPALASLNAACTHLDPEGKFLHYRGAAGFDELHMIYRDADAFVFASSCENLPNILIEAMAAGLPIASSNAGPMPEVLGDAGVYFDPRQPADIAQAISTLYKDQGLRDELAHSAWQRSAAYSWRACAEQTFAFIRHIADTSRKAGGTGRP